MSGKVIVNRSMSLDGFIAGPGDAMDWVFDFVAPDEFPEVAAATGAMLIGRRTYEVGNRMAADNPGRTGYPFSGPVFVLTHEPPDPPNPAVTFLTGDIGERMDLEPLDSTRSGAVTILRFRVPKRRSSPP